VFQEHSLGRSIEALKSFFVGSVLLGKFTMLPQGLEVKPLHSNKAYAFPTVVFFYSSFPWLLYAFAATGKFLSVPNCQCPLSSLPPQTHHLYSVQPSFHILV